jgi:hypothetical protein
MLVTEADINNVSDGEENSTEGGADGSNFLVDGERELCLFV